MKDPMPRHRHRMPQNLLVCRQANGILLYCSCKRMAGRATRSNRVLYTVLYVSGCFIIVLVNSKRMNLSLLPCVLSVYLRLVFIVFNQVAQVVRAWAQHRNIQWNLSSFDSRAHEIDPVRRYLILLCYQYYLLVDNFSTAKTASARKGHCTHLSIVEDGHEHPWHRWLPAGVTVESSTGADIIYP